MKNYYHPCITFSSNKVSAKKVCHSGMIMIGSMKLTLASSSSLEKTALSC